MEDEYSGSEPESPVEFPELVEASGRGEKTIGSLRQDMTMNAPFFTESVPAEDSRHQGFRPHRPNVREAHRYVARRLPHRQGCGLGVLLFLWELHARCNR